MKPCQSGYDEKKVKKGYIKEYLKKMKPIKPHMDN